MILPWLMVDVASLVRMFLLVDTKMINGNVLIKVDMLP